ncbi:MAG: hypothetical protein A2W91_02340 [Bacteroidetes bacterium GWF2_38_335]|nr:MAG: hypothetical protein A2W91_02340 [Bacteroidetes bacterium GWF2_38_335]OFY80688.1 MAG: hypothetical protein A2281_05355 [Bacteroidetes bacterium RIFOXYA12_FULL_38_20]HBS87034.1 DNA-binding response regulator [Bacteroidales bacterium]
MKKIKIMLVDDHEVVINGIRTVLKGVEDIEVIEDACDGDMLLKKLKYLTPDLIMMDLSLPKKSGVEMTRLIRVEYPKIKIIIFSANINEESIFDAIKAGANGYLSKDASREQIIDAIRRVMEGEKVLSDSISNTLLINYIEKDKKQEKFSEKKVDGLTKREIEILKLIAEGHTYKEIAEELFISFRTVETHKNNIMYKLELKNTVDLVKFAIKNKLVDI